MENNKSGIKATTILIILVIVAAVIGIAIWLLNSGKKTATPTTAQSSPTNSSGGIVTVGLPAGAQLPGDGVLYTQAGVSLVQSIFDFIKTNKKNTQNQSTGYVPNNYTVPTWGGGGNPVIIQ